MIDLLNFALGALVALAFVALCRMARKTQWWWIGVGLLLAALAYPGMGLGARGAAALPAEWLGTALFGFFALLGVVRSPWFLAAGWALHAAWDFVLPAVADAGYVPAWYAMACVGFDALVALYVAAVLVGWLRAPGAQEPAAA